MIGKKPKRAKKLVWAAIVVSVLAASIKPAKAQSHQNYFPLNIGNSWTYTDGAEEKTFIITGTEQINGHTYYKFDDYIRICGFPGYDSYPPDDNDIFFRYDPCSDRVLQYWPSINEDRVRYDFSQNTWGDYQNQLVQTGLSCTVPAGTFDDCCKFRFAMDLRCGDFNEMLAPDVGNIRFDTPETGTFELEGYTIASQPSCGDPDYPYPAGDLNHDCRVDMPDFAIFAANWLESTGPGNCNSVVKDGIEYYIQTDKAVYNLSENVQMSYKVTNLTAADVVIQCFQMPEFNLWVQEDGETIWELYLAFWASLSGVELAPGESEELFHNWDMEDINDVPVGPGTYDVVGVTYTKTTSPKVGVPITIIAGP